MKSAFNDGSDSSDVTLSAVWASSDESVATVDSDQSPGLVTAQGPGDVTFTATVQVDDQTAVVGSLDLHVKDPNAGPIDEQSDGAGGVAGIAQ